MTRLKSLMALIGVLLVAFAFMPTQLSAASDFQAGNIMSDSVFTNKNSMTAAQIQSFLNAKMPACDTWGAKPYGGTTRAQYAASIGISTPFICLKDYSENGRSSAQIIYDVGQKYTINPQVLVVLLQKEQGLVTDDWPWPIQYRSATGYGCPDTAPCDAQYYGLTNQLDWAAKMFRAILDDSPTWYTPYELGNNFVQYSPDGSCGGSVVNIQNRTTQALYNYTPYQPNQAAIDAGWGMAPCGAYGNRNFSLYFREWFGSTVLTHVPGCEIATNTTLSCLYKAQKLGSGESVTTSYEVANDLVNRLGYTYIGISYTVRNPSAPQSGNIPVYGMTKPDGSSFITPDISEYNALSSAFTPNGVIFYADPAYSNTGYPVYRMYNSSTARHAWTRDRSAYESQGYVQEGVAFTSLSNVAQSTAPGAGKDVVYRFRDMPENRHFWTTDIYERDRMITEGYKYDGAAWISSQTVTDKPVYRLYSPTMQKHLFTADAYEKDVLSGTSSWRYEGIAFYANSNGSAPVYRLYRTQNAAHFYTSDLSERNRLISSGTFRDEGVAWLQP